MTTAADVVRGRALIDQIISQFGMTDELPEGTPLSAVITALCAECFVNNKGTPRQRHALRTVYRDPSFRAILSVERLLRSDW